MRRITFITLLASLQTVLSHPVDQSLEISHLSSNESSPVLENPNHDGCTPHAPSRGPRPDEDTPDAFRNHGDFYNIAASARVPGGYDLVAQAINGSVANDLGILDVVSVETYDTEKCGGYCSDRPFCASFFIYFERNPLYEPNRTAGCPNPPSTTEIKCALCAHALSPSEGPTIGQGGGMREDFEVAVVGSNLYNKNSGVMNLTGVGFVGPRVDVDNNAALAIPNEPVNKYNTLMRREVLPYGASNPFYDPEGHDILPHYDASVCARLCVSLTNEAQPTYPFTNGAMPMCSMFVAYELQTMPELGGLEWDQVEAISMVCEVYTSVWSSRYQSVRQVRDFAYGQEVQMRPARVSIYDRAGYPYPPICAMNDTCGDQYYEGGDCSGWGKGHC